MVKRYLRTIATLAVMTACTTLLSGHPTAQAQDSSRSIGGVAVSNPSDGTLSVIWGSVNDQDQVAYASWRATNSDTAGNAYPDSDVTSHTITGLSPGNYEVRVRARYNDNNSGPWASSAQVQVAEPVKDPRLVARSVHRERDHA